MTGLTDKVHETKNRPALYNQCKKDVNMTNHVDNSIDAFSGHE